MIFNCKETDKPVGVMVDGVVFITSDFCHSQHVVNVSTINVCEAGLQECIDDLEST